MLQKSTQNHPKCVLFQTLIAHSALSTSEDILDIKKTPSHHLEFIMKPFLKTLNCSFHLYHLKRLSSTHQTFSTLITIQIRLVLEHLLPIGKSQRRRTSQVQMMGNYHRLLNPCWSQNILWSELEMCKWESSEYLTSHNKASRHYFV